MSIENITSKITDDAKREADQILDEARRTAKAIEDEAKANADKIRHSVGRDGAKEKEKIISRRQAVADIDSRKLILQAKRELMDQCFDDALKKLVSMDEKEYVPFLEGIVRKSGLTEGEIILNKKDHAAVGEQLLKRLNADGKKFTIAEEDGSFEGGLMIRSGSVYLNGTAESYIDEARETMAREVSEVLFGTEE